MKAKKSLGQNFLTSDNIAKWIVTWADVTPDEIVLEIGPGKGMLTKHLLFFGSKVIAIEKDSDLVQNLQEQFAREIAEGKLDLVEKDVLDFDTEILRFYEFPYQVIANIPYNITGKILRHFLTSKYKPESMILMVQKEVGERILAKNGKESVLSISVKAFGEPFIVKNVPAKHFLPKPKVDSVVIKIDNISDEFLENIDQKSFFQMVKTGFKEKRKKLSNNLSGLVGKERILEILEQLNIDKNIRAEDLSVENWKQIYLAVNS